jgi:hypothetical protein
MAPAQPDADFDRAVELVEKHAPLQGPSGSMMMSAALIAHEAIKLGRLLEKQSKS